MDKVFKSGFVTIIGRPNVGKSTLMNCLLGEKISIISSKPQTTRNNIKTVITKDNYQIVFIDTPGIHKPKNQLGEFMIKSARDTLNEVDLILYMITPDTYVGNGDKLIMETLEKIKTPVILVINKIDEVNNEKLIKTISVFNQAFKFCEVVPISALKGNNVNEILDVIVNNLPSGPKYYPDDMLTDQSERFIVSEIIREKALRMLQDEVPHGIAVEILEMKEENNITKISSTIFCEKDSHKGIIIGKGGLMLKKIGTYARNDIEKMLGTKVYLELWVKVKKDWRDNSTLLKDFGYK